MRTILLATVALWPMAAAAQQSIPVQQLATSVAAKIQATGFAGINLGQGTANGVALSAVQSQAASALHLDANGKLSGKTISGGDVSAALYNLNAATATSRSLRDKFSEIVDVKDSRAVGDGLANDTAAINAAIATANANLARFRATALYLPPGSYRVGTLNPILDPQGVPFAVYGASGAARLIETQAGVDTLSIQETKPTGAPGGFATAAAVDISVSYQNAGQGRSGISFVGMPITSGGGGMRPYFSNVNCLSLGSGVLTNCVRMWDVSNASGFNLRNASIGNGNGDPNGGTALAIGATADQETRNYSNDGAFFGIVQGGGFAAVRMTNHIEGLHLEDVTAVGSSYLLYGPAWNGTTHPYGPSWLTLAHSHGNNTVAGVYLEDAGSIHLHDNLIFSTNQGSNFPTYAPNALLPLNWSALLSGHQWGWAAVWCTNCRGYEVSHNELYGNTNPGQSATGVLLDMAAINGNATPTDLHPGVVSDNMIQAMSSGPMQIGSAYNNVAITGNIEINTAVPLGQFLPSGAVLAGNVQDGAPFDIGVMGNVAYIKPPLDSLTINHELTVNGNATLQNTNVLAGKSIALGTGVGKTSVGVSGDGAGNLNITGSTITTGASTVDGTATQRNSTTNGLQAIPIMSTAALPSGCTARQIAYASDGRKPNEASGAGSGVLVFCSPGTKGGATTWISVLSGATVTN
ncbi:glycosyl hydrolase family 28-related protein [Rhizosaccharibacter radicis]|uniref:Rhamnogalacturonase A/B/Epimerase-like pectate lyase domain-containing protein n=1 Tax=Rhizosaccharibacter radicis TaxID=2782605 RepID=A0ABT1VT93_9PROT|nr:hypothetical protein [Acetobacteraceae bacterium KSS12]